MGLRLKPQDAKGFNVLVSHDSYVDTSKRGSVERLFLFRDNNNVDSFNLKNIFTGQEYSS